MSDIEKIKTTWADLHDVANFLYKHDHPDDAGKIMAAADVLAELIDEADIGEVAALVDAAFGGQA